MTIKNHIFFNIYMVEGEKMKTLIWFLQFL